MFEVAYSSVNRVSVKAVLAQFSFSDIKWPIEQFLTCAQEVQMQMCLLGQTKQLFKSQA